MATMATTNFDQPANSFYNVEQFHNYLISEGAEFTDPEFKLYGNKCKVYDSIVFGHTGLEKYYNSDEVDYWIKIDQGADFVKHVHANVPRTINVRDYKLY